MLLRRVAFAALERIVPQILCPHHKHHYGLIADCHISKIERATFAGVLQEALVLAGHTCSL